MNITLNEFDLMIGKLFMTKQNTTYLSGDYSQKVYPPDIDKYIADYDTYGNPLTSKTAAHPAITYTYDAIGRMTDLYDQVNAHTGFVYDNRGLLQSKTDPLQMTSYFTYYNNGNLWTGKDRKNQTITYAYTPTDKIDTITYPDASTVRFTYNSLDQLTSMQDAIGMASPYVYDEAGHLTSMTDSNGFTISYAYDAAGNLTQITYPGNKNVSYTYDQLNRLQTVKIDWLNQTATYNTYDAAGRLILFTNFNGTKATYGYDNANRLTSINNQKGDNSVISNYTFTLDGNGNRTSTAQTEPYAPVIGDGSAVTYGYNTAGNRLTAVAGASYTYDNEGQLLTSNGGANAYTFDYEHRLKTITGTNAAQFYYDGGGNRLKAIRSGTETRYIYDAAGRLLAEADSSNNITRYYIYGNGLLAMVTPAGQTYCYHYNGVGSTMAMTNGTQAVVNKYSYDAFGNIANQQEAVAQPFKYVGQAGVMTEPNGFYYMKARYYDPTVGRFISEDPSGFGGGDVNLSSYTGNNPITRIDPFGDAYLEIRPLDQWPLQDTTAGPFYHSGFIYDNNDNSSYNPDRNNPGIARVGFDQAGDTMTAKYQTVGVYLQDYTLHQAEANLRSAWDQTTNPNAPNYDLLSHNCHGYTNAVINEYYKLLSQPFIDKLGGVFTRSAK